MVLEPGLDWVAAVGLPIALGTASPVLPRERQRQKPPASHLQEAGATSQLVFSLVKLRGGQEGNGFWREMALAGQEPAGVENKEKQEGLWVV